MGDKSISALIGIGALLSNIAYNWGQSPRHVISLSEAESLLELQRKWDAAVREYRRAPEPNHGPESLTAQGLLSALEADTLTGTQRAALAAMIRGRENG